MWDRNMKQKKIKSMCGMVREKLTTTTILTIRTKASATNKLLGLPQKRKLFPEQTFPSSGD
jgi:hypothetical protein